MQLTWHIMKKDVRRFWPGALMLSVLVVLECYCGYLLLTVTGEFDSGSFARISGYSEILSILQLLVVALLTAAVIQEDGFTGRRTSWMSRPISNRRLLTAKVAVLALCLCVIPTFAAVPWWWYTGLGSGQVFANVGKMTATSGTVVLLAAPFALITPSIGRFLLSVFICLLFFVFATFAFSGAGAFREVTPELKQSQVLVTNGIILAMSLIVILLQLRRCSIYRASGVLAFGYLMGIMTTHTWPWVLPTIAPTQDGETSLTSQIATKVGHVERIGRDNDRYLGYRIMFELVGIPDGRFLTGMSGPGQRLIWPDAEATIRVIGPFSTPSTIPNVRQILGIGGDAPAPASTVRYTHLLNIAPSVTERFRATPPTYELVGYFKLHTPLILGEIALRQNNEILHSAHSVRILDTRADADGLKVSIVEARADRDGSRMAINSAGWTTPTMYDESIHYYMVNRQLQRVLKGERNAKSSTSFRACSVAHVEIIWREVVFRDAVDSPPVGEDPAWSLAGIAPDKSITFERRLTFPASLFSTD